MARTPTKTIRQGAGGLITGHVGLGRWGGVTGSVRQGVHDGDTLTVRSDLNFGVRFLNIDAPEVSAPLPTPVAAADAPPVFLPLDDERWIAFLDDPFAPPWPPFAPALEEGLAAHLRGVTGPGSALAHRRGAKLAEDLLEREVERDLAELGLEEREDDFRYFLAFAHEVMDRYGRFLCWINRYQPARDRPAPRPPDYNERLLALGAAFPYFIWPNLDPFFTPALTEAVLTPAAVKASAANPATPLGRARAAVRRAREGGAGIFGAADPVRLRPFELRFLGRRRPPDRWVIDLAADDGVLHPPQRYVEIGKDEDRLFVGAEYVPLFVAAGKGWRRGE
jgi:hypothetical protein